MKKENDVLIKCIRYAITGEGNMLSKQEFTPELIKNLYRISKFHDLAHVVGDVLINEGILLSDDECYALFKQQILKAVYRVENIQDITFQIKAVFEETNIPYILLKGSRIRDLYSKDWYRTSCDVDVLIEKEQTENAIRKLKEKLNFKSFYATTHDVQLKNEADILLELHHTLIEETKFDCVSEYLSKVWDRAISLGKKERVMDNVDFYVYHVAHMAKHVKGGGIGIKPFIDLYIMKKEMGVDASLCIEALKKCKLYDFAVNAEKLTNAWFRGEGKDRTCEMFEKYILQSGTYGSIENSSSIEKTNKKSFWAKIWKPKEELKYWYPNLEKKGWLLPYYQIKRWFKIVFKGTARKMALERRKRKTVDSAKVEVNKKLLKELGLK